MGSGNDPRCSWRIITLLLTITSCLLLVRLFWWGSSLSSDRLVAIAWSDVELSLNAEVAREEEELQYRDTIHLASVACQKNYSTDNLVVLLKSVLYHFDATDQDLHIHIFTDNTTQYRLDEHEASFFSLMDVLPYVTLTQYDVHGINISDEHLNLFHPCAGARLAFPHILPFKNIEKLIYLDSDTVMLTRIVELWSFFNSFESHQHSAMTLENYRAHELSYYLHPQMALSPCPDDDKHCVKVYGKLGINSGVYLMHLDRMRAINLYDSLMEIVRGPMKEHPSRFHTGDQDVLNTYFHDHPNEMFELPCEWNFRTDSACPFRPAILHGNRGVFRQRRQQLWSTHWHAFDNLPHTAFIDPKVARRLRRELTAKLPAGTVPGIEPYGHFDNLTDIEHVWEWE